MPIAKTSNTTNQGTGKQARGTVKKNCGKPITSILKINTIPPDPNGKSGQGTLKAKTHYSSRVGRTDKANKQKHSRPGSKSPSTTKRNKEMPNLQTELVSNFPKMVKKLVSSIVQSRAAPKLSNNQPHVPNKSRTCDR